jgi:archaellum biogenesis protein FlaJ (TadC family)
MINYLVSRNPLLKKKLRMAKIDIKPEDYLKTSLKNAVMMGIFVFVMIFLFMGKENPTITTPLIAGLIAGKLMYNLSIKKIDVKIAKRGKEIDRDVLFAGRFLLIKLNSGKPLINAIQEASEGFGATTEYFRDIMRNIEMGTPLETALEEGSEYCPSEHLKKILFQISNALKIGVDVTNFLESILDEIAEHQLTEIVRYGKKLSSLTMFYMLAAIIVPSLGMTMFIVVASMMNIPLGMLTFSGIVFFLFILQFIFITLFKAARPNMEV